MTKKPDHTKANNELAAPVELTPAQLTQVAGGYGPVMTTGSSPQGYHTQIWAK